MIDTKDKDFIFGIHPVQEAIRSHASIDKVLIQKGLKSQIIQEIRNELRKAGVIWQEVPKEKLNKISRANHQGIIALISPVLFQDIETILPCIFEKGETPLLLVLDRITDVRNFGAICRTAESAGVHAIIIPEKGSARIGGDVVKTSAGAVMHIPICKAKSLKNVFEFLSKSGVHILACSEKGNQFYFDTQLSLPIALVLGSEEDGISPEYFSYCDAHIKIPMQGKTSSLNVSVAAGIILFECIRQRMAAV